MLDAAKDLPNDPAVLKGLVASLASELKSRDLLIEKLKHQLAGLRRHQFGSRSEALDQLELTLEEAEIARAAETPATIEADDPAGEKRQPKRRPLPDHLARHETVLSVGEACAACGGKLKQLGQDVTEELEYVPGRFVVNRIVRPRMACSCCERIVQAPLPSRPIERGRPGPGLLAHVLVKQIRRSFAALPAIADLRPGRHRSGSLDPSRLGGQIRCSAGTAGQGHRAPCAVGTGDLRR